jgi:hypothetical protein
MAIQHLPLAPQSEESTSLATKLIATKAIPASEPEDALHIALAVVHKFDFVASWNFAHLVGATAKLRLVKHIANLGYVPPIIATPEELMEEKQWTQE